MSPTVIVVSRRCIAAARCRAGCAREIRWQSSYAAQYRCRVMLKLPLAHPGSADTRTPSRYLWWVARGQRATLLGAAFFGIVWMVAQSVMPAVIGRAIDA